MSQRPAVKFEDCSNLVYEKMVKPGLLLTAVGTDGVPNVMTIGWGLWGRFYHGHPMFVVAVTPLRYTWHLLEQVPEFVVAVPGDGLDEAVHVCGTRSGRDGDKFAMAGLIPLPSCQVRPPSIAQCPVNIECRVFHPQHPPHQLLTPEHRQAPLPDQHTIYFAEVLGLYRMQTGK